MYNIDSLI